MNTALIAIALADDVAVIRAAEFFHLQMSNELLAAGIEQRDLIALASTKATLREILESADERSDEHVSDAEAVATARRILVSAAGDEKFSGFVEHCILHSPEDRLAVGKGARVGLFATLLLMIATTEIEYRDGSLTIHKRAAVPTYVEIVSSQVRSAFELRVKLDQGTSASK